MQEPVRSVDPSSDETVVRDLEGRGRAARLRRVGLELAAVSFVVLFQELAFIRWLPTQVRVVAYFPNLVLISAFLGLGLGALRARGRPLLWMWPVAVSALVGIAWAFSQVAFTARGVSEHLWLLYYDLPEDGLVYPGVRLPLLVLFVLSAVSFVPLGQAIGVRLNRYRDDSSPLWGYAFDLGGSLLGVVAFALASFLGLFPVFWFAAFLLAGGVFLLSKKGTRVVWILGASFVLVAVSASERATAYSPYYAITVDPPEGGARFALLANGALHQIARSVQKADSLVYEDDIRVRNGYHLPFEDFDLAPRRVLVLGAGTGNDVAALLDHGVEHIDAVEIDPVIAGIGRRMHPNDPYGSPKVTLHNMDARTFLNDSEELYDLIVFGTLDSMTRISALGNVRLDNFVYTTDALEAARARLAPAGGIAMYFMVGEDYIHQRLMGMLAATFGRPPAVVKGGFAVFNHIYLAGPAFADLPTMSVPNQERYMGEFLPLLDLPTDDWPYLYLESREVGSFYLSLMALFLIVSIIGVLLVSREMRAAFRGRQGVDVEMFLFGLAFLLIETHFVTAMSLVWGVSWLTSAVVFGAILLMILLGTVIMELRPLSWNLAAGGLILSLLVGYAIPPSSLLFSNDTLRLLASMAYVGTPVFFASACFALRFRTRTAVDLAFGWNVLGAVAGGLIEFFSMSYGLRAMALLAVVAYLMAFLRKGAKVTIADEVEAAPALPEAEVAIA